MQGAARTRPSPLWRRAGPGTYRSPRHLIQFKPSFLVFFFLPTFIEPRGARVVSINQTRPPLHYMTWWAQSVRPWRQGGALDGVLRQSHAGLAAAVAAGARARDVDRPSGGAGRRAHHRSTGGKVRPGTHCSPRRRMPFNSIDQGLNCVPMTWRAMSIADGTFHVVRCQFTQ